MFVLLYYMYMYASAFLFFYFQVTVVDNFFTGRKKNIDHWYVLTNNVHVHVHVCIYMYTCMYIHERFTSTCTCVYGIYAFFGWYNAFKY